MEQDVDEGRAPVGPHRSTVRGAEPTYDARRQDIVWDIKTKVLDIEELYAAVIADIQRCRGLCGLDALVMNQASWLREVVAGRWTGLLVDDTVGAIRSLHKPSRTFEVCLSVPTIADLELAGHYAKAYFRARTIVVRSYELLDSQSGQGGTSNSHPFQLHGHTLGPVFSAGQALPNYWYSWKVGP